MSAVTPERAVLWSGKGDDRNIKLHGTTLINDLWGLEVTESTETSESCPPRLQPSLLPSLPRHLCPFPNSHSRLKPVETANHGESPARSRRLCSASLRFALRFPPAVPAENSPDAGTLVQSPDDGSDGGHFATAHDSLAQTPKSSSSDGITAHSPESTSVWRWALHPRSATIAADSDIDDDEANGDEGRGDNGGVVVDGDRVLNDDDGQGGAVLQGVSQGGQGVQHSGLRMPLTCAHSPAASTARGTTHRASAREPNTHLRHCTNSIPAPRNPLSN